MGKVVVGFTGDKYKIPEILNWEDYRYANDLSCNCGHVSLFADKPMAVYMVGIANTHFGEMACFECPNCGDRIRYHSRDDEYLGDCCYFHPEWKI